MKKVPNKVSSLKLFVVRKYIYANNASDALKKERSVPADECWVDDEWKKVNMTQPEKDNVGFKRK